MHPTGQHRSLINHQPNLPIPHNPDNSIHPVSPRHNSATSLSNAQKQKENPNPSHINNFKFPKDTQPRPILCDTATGRFIVLIRSTSPGVNKEKEKKEKEGLGAATTTGTACFIILLYSPNPSGRW
jgi:hypothetical protein